MNSFLSITALMTTGGSMEQYIQQVLNGDADAYEYIVRQYQNQIFRYVNKIIQNPEGASEVTQDVFVTGYYKLNQYSSNYSIKTWLYKIAKNLTINYMNKQKRHQSLVKKVKQFSSRTESYSLDSNEDTFDLAIEYALSTLKTEEKNLLLLKSVEELTYNELAQIYDVQEATIRKRYERTRKKFKAAYTEGSNEHLCQY